MSYINKTDSKCYDRRKHYAGLNLKAKNRGTMLHNIFFNILMMLAGYLLTGFILSVTDATAPWKPYMIVLVCMIAIEIVLFILGSIALSQSRRAADESIIIRVSLEELVNSEED